MSDPIKSAVPFLNLRAQYAALREEIRAALDEVLTSQKFILGPQGEVFEREIASYCDTRHAVGLANGTDALTIALAACGIGAGRRSDRARIYICRHGYSSCEAWGAARISLISTPKHSISIPRKLNVDSHLKPKP